MHYWTDFRADHRIEAETDVLGFWEGIGYTGNGWASLPTNSPADVAKRTRNRQAWFRCEHCKQWQTIASLEVLRGGAWVCARNPEHRGVPCAPPVSGQPDPTIKNNTVASGRPIPTAAEVAAAAKAASAASAAKANAAALASAALIRSPESVDDLPPTGRLAKAAEEAWAGLLGSLPSATRYSHDSPETSPRRSIETKQNVAESRTLTSSAPPPLRKRESPPTPIVQKATLPELEAQLENRVRECVDRVTPPDVLSDLGLEGDRFGTAHVLPKLAADFTVFLMTCNEETEEEVSVLFRTLPPSDSENLQPFL